ncbi:hypothetical protein [Burkholderia latens]|uniref:NACHT domain-containing protein n=1 Tax=Burkholderia latens TaxID=488446 RepID=A0A6H9SRX0_9BURK|nr:hypothetical protein [Burkholderia latens]KAB0643837.1 hypothetical protein F7R21_05475 [Burkholderia latens]VWB47393.1 hypothetical protein BLA24064_02138 [Burkholderia latens]
MDINDLRRILTAFADEPSDVDIRLGRIVAQVRDEVVEATVHYSETDDRHLRVVENGQEYSARSWLINRVARVPQLADRIIAATATNSKLPFVVPSGRMSADLSAGSVEDLPVANVVESLLGRASAPVPGATSVLYVTSDAGEGKTTVINRASLVQAQRYKEKKATSLVVPIPLSGRAFLTFDDAVIAALVNKLRFNYLYFDAFIELVRMGVVIPAFDGYEEMLVEGAKGEAISALGTLVQRLESSGTVFIAARKAFFEYLSFRTQARLLDAIGDRSAAFMRLALSRWSREQFCEYGQLRSVDAPEAVYETVATRLGADHPLLTRAVLVRRLFDVLDGADQTELVDLLGANPHDYFFTFVDAIVKREASEKWLARGSGDVMEPLLQQNEHHQILSQIAVEMWQSSSTSLRYDVLDLIVDIFCDGLKKSGAVIRQVKERIKQHSLLSADTSRGQGIGFDHEDFQNFFLGEGLGLILSEKATTGIQAFLSVNIVPTATIEQAIQYLVRHQFDLRGVLDNVITINRSEAGYSFCKENCGALAIRLVECMPEGQSGLLLRSMFFPAGALGGRALKHVRFEECHFQPTHIAKSSLTDVAFVDCNFERLEITSGESLAGCSFGNCQVDSLVSGPGEEHSYDPALIVATLRSFDATIDECDAAPVVPRVTDDKLKLIERFLRVFLRHTHVDEEAIRIRLGKGFASTFFDGILPVLLSEKVLEEATWRGQGVQRRFKLVRPMSDIGDALEQSQGQFNRFVAALKQH